jgi:cysteinyl-tRNA synthetase
MRDNIWIKKFCYQIQFERLSASGTSFLAIKESHKDWDQRRLHIFLIIWTNFNKNMIFVISAMRSTRSYVKYLD